MTFSTEHLHRDGDHVVRLVGELDMASAADAERALADAANDGPGRVIVDLSELTFLDSTGLRTLLDAHAQASETGGRFVLCCVQPNVRRVLTLTGTEERFSFLGDD